MAIKRFLEPKIKAEAEQRQNQTIPKKGQKGFQCASDLDAHRTDSTIAKVVGVNKDTLRKDVAVVEAAEKLVLHLGSYTKASTEHTKKRGFCGRNRHICCLRLLVPVSKL